MAIHRIRRAWLRQMIYCAAGWVRVVYEDAGMEFVLRPVSLVPLSTLLYGGKGY